MNFIELKKHVTAFLTHDEEVVGIRTENLEYGENYIVDYFPIQYKIDEFKEQYDFVDVFLEVDDEFYTEKERALIKDDALICRFYNDQENKSEIYIGKYYGNPGDYLKYDLLASNINSLLYGLNIVSKLQIAHFWNINYFFNDDDLSLKLYAISFMSEKAFTEFINENPVIKKFVSVFDTFRDGESINLRIDMSSSDVINLTKDEVLYMNNIYAKFSSNEDSLNFHFFNFPLFDSCCNGRIFEKAVNTDIKGNAVDIKSVLISLGDYIVGKTFYDALIPDCYGKEFVVSYDSSHIYMTLCASLEGYDVYLPEIIKETMKLFDEISVIEEINEKLRCSNYAFNTVTMVPINNYICLNISLNSVIDDLDLPF